MKTENHYQETDLGNISPNPRGEYSDAESYEYLDLVEYQGGSYLCLAELGTIITGIAPEPGKNTESWQVITIPGGLTPEYVAAHDHVINLAEQTAADAEETRTAREAVEGMETNVAAMQAQTTQAASAAEASKDAAAGYAQAADTSRQAAETAEANINAQITGFDDHVAEKTAESETAIETARIAANAAVVAQQNESVQAVKNQTAEYIATKQAEAEAAVEEKAGVYAADVDADIQAVKTAAATQIFAIEDTGAAQVDAVNAAGVAQRDAIVTTGTTQKQAVETAGAKQVSNINATGNNQVGVVQQEGGAQVAAVQEAAAEIMADREQIEVNRQNILNAAGAIKGTAEGTHITLEDAAEMPLSGMVQYGWTEQDTTTGAQLFDFEDGTTSGNGVTLSRTKETGTWQITGTATGTGGRLILTGGIDIALNAGTYTFAQERIAGNTEMYIFASQKIDNAALFSINETPIVKTFDDDINIIIGINVVSGNTYDEKIRITINAGSTAMPWEPYTGGQPSPNPEYPQEFISAGNKGSIETVVCGKNLYNKDRDYSVNGEVNPFLGKDIATSQSTNIQVPISLDVGEFVGQTVSVSFDIRADVSKTIQVYPYQNSGVIIQGNFNFDIGDDWTHCFYTGVIVDLPVLYNNHGKIIFYNAELNNNNLQVKNLQIELGTESTDYEPYIDQTITLTTPTGLPGIPVSSGGNYTDENGQQWIADYRDWERGVDVQRVWKYTFTGEETGMDDYYPVLILKLPSEVPVGDAVEYSNALFITHAPLNKVRYSNVTGRDIGFYADYFGVENTDQLKSLLLENYENGSYLEIMYVLKEPIETPIPAEELAAYHTARTVKGVTNIINDAGVYTDVEYTKDTETYMKAEHEKILETNTQAIVERLQNISFAINDDDGGLDIIIE